MFKGLGLERNHFLIALIPWAVAIVSVPFILFLAGIVFFGVAAIVLVVCWIKKDVVYMGKVLLALFIITILLSVLGLLMEKFQSGLYWIKRLYLYNL